MSRMSWFFDFFFLFLTLLTTTSLVRRELTYKGIFYILVPFLVIFFIYMMSVLHLVFIWGATWEFHLYLSPVRWHSIEMAFVFRFDMLSFSYVLLVLVIGLGTNIYTLNYMKYEAHEDIFLLLINWFMFSMMFLVLANNLFTLFLGWESIGLSSFFLINHWSTRRGTVKSSFKAFLFNKMSDLFLFLFIICINSVFFCNNLHVLNTKCVLNLVGMTNIYEIAAISLFICTLFKSAQLIGHLWLPDSMEAPVPASALIHSATLVSAGVYLLLRFAPLITINGLQNWALIVGSITAAYGGVVSAAQTDMKKLLAYSTISHCGFLFVTIGTGLYTTSLIYLFMHGLFKALTFFCAGSFIRVAGSQDTRNMGALSRLIPVDTIFLIIAAFNLGGLPFSLGYLYKSMLIMAVLNSTMSMFVLGFCTVGLLSSLVYVYRLVYYSAFDISKEFFLSLVYELQQKQINVVRYWSLTSIVQIIASTLLICFSLWIYCFFTSYFIYSELTLDHFPILLESNASLLKNTNVFYKSYYEVFYSLYLLVFAVIMVVGWRYEYTFMYKLNFIVSLTLTLCFFVVWTTIL